MIRTMVLNVVATTFTVYANSKPYVRDHVNLYSSNLNAHENRSFGRDKNDENSYIVSVENYNFLRINRSGDCEDMAHDCLLNAMQMKTNRTWKNATLKLMSDLMQNYLVTLCHGVSSQPKTDCVRSELRNDDDSVSGHTFCVLIPYHRVLKMTERTSTDAKMLGMTNETIDMTKNNSELDVLICEGTGFIRPIMMSESEYVRMNESSRRDTSTLEADFERFNPQFENCRKIHSSDQVDDSSVKNWHDFYRVVIGAYIPVKIRTLATSNHD
jgi:uncharacterized protein (UPF0248 family)